MSGNYNLTSYYRAHAQAAKEYGVKARLEEATFYTPEAQRLLWE